MTNKAGGDKKPSELIPTLFKLYPEDVARLEACRAALGQRAAKVDALRFALIEGEKAAKKILKKSAN